MSRSILQYFYEQDDTETDATDETTEKETPPQAPPEKKSGWSDVVTNFLKKKVSNTVAGETTKKAYDRMDPNTAFKY